MNLNLLYPITKRRNLSASKRRRLQLEQFEHRRLLAAVHEPQALQASGATDASIDLVWNAPDKGADSYLVAVQTDASPSEGCASGTPTAQTSFALSGLESSTYYRFRVCAVNGKRVSDGVTLTAWTDPLNNDAGLLASSRGYAHRTAVSDNGHRLTVWMNHEDSRWQLYFTRDDGQNVLETGRLSPEGRQSYYGRWKHLDVAAGEEGSFVVAWLDQDSLGGDARLNVNRYISGTGWDHPTGQNGDAAATPTFYAINGENRERGVGAFDGVNVDFAPSGDAAVAVNESTSLGHVWLSAFYREANANAWERIATDGTLVDASRGYEDATNPDAPAMGMDVNGNILVAFATDQSLITGDDTSGRDIHYAVYDKAAQSWGPGRQTFITNQPYIDTVRVAVDRTRDLTDASATDLRGLAGIAWETRYDEIYGAVYYNNGGSDLIDQDFTTQLNASAVGTAKLNGFDIAESEGHILATWTNTATNNQELTHFWYEDADSDGLLDSAEEPLELDGRQVAGWKTNAVIVNDATILNSPYATGDVSYQGEVAENVSQLSVGSSGGLIVWPALAQDALHMRRITGFDAQNQTVQLDGDSVTEIQPANHHTLEVSSSSESDGYDYWGATANVHDSTGEGTVLFRGVNDSRLKLVPFEFTATPGITVASSTDFVTTEAGGQVTLDVVLDTQPTSDVTITVASSDLSEGTVDTTSLSFDATNWDTPQQVTVTGIDDTEIDGDIAYTVSFDPSSSLDADYATLAVTNAELVNLDNENQPPLANDDSYSALAGETLQVTAPGLLSNDTDADGDSLTVNTIPVTPPSGTLSLSADGAFTYTAASGFSGTDTFIYEISDGNGGTATAEVTIDVTAPPTGDANDIYVWDISFQTRQRGKNTDLRIAVDVNRDSNADGFASDSDAAAAGILVIVELRDANGAALIQTFEGTTDDQGIVQFDWVRKVDPGDYTAEAVDLAHETFNWNHALDLGFDDEDQDDDGLPDDTLTIS